MIVSCSVLPGDEPKPAEMRTCAPASWSVWSPISRRSRRARRAPGAGAEARAGARALGGGRAGLGAGQGRRVSRMKPRGIRPPGLLIVANRVGVPPDRLPTQMPLVAGRAGAAGRVDDVPMAGRRDRSRDRRAGPAGRLLAVLLIDAGIGAGRVAAQRIGEDAAIRGRDAGPACHVMVEQYRSRWRNRGCWWRDRSMPSSTPQFGGKASPVAPGSVGIAKRRRRG